MLIKCPECELQVSDKALSCPHCGYPMKNQPRKYKSNKRKRLPNGFGQITELKGQNLRKPYRVMVTVGKNSSGRPICKLLKPEAYFKTYNDAYQALVEYNKNPYDLEADITLIQLYEKWSEEYFKTLASASSIRTIEAAWKYCSPLYDMRVKDIRAYHIKNVMEHGSREYKGEIKTASPGIKKRIKSIFNLMLDYAVEYEIADRNYARTFEISSGIIKEEDETKRSHIAFTDKEMKILWDNKYVQYVDLVLIQCYTGFRPQELGLIELENVDIENWSIIGGMKTEAGINRYVPIHPAIRPFVKKLYEMEKARGSKYLINCYDGRTHLTNVRMTYEKYRSRFNTLMKNLGLNPEHRPHDPRKQFITMAKKYNVDEYAIKYIVGHAINDITESVYTERRKDWLQTEISKIDVHEWSVY